MGKLLLSDDTEVRDPEEGIRWLKEAAENGNQWAAYRLGKEYLTGEVVTQDASKAVAWFTLSAEAGNQYAQYLLGKLYLTGQGVTHDQTKRWIGSADPPPREISMLSSSWSRETISARPLSCWRSLTCSTT